MTQINRYTNPGVSSGAFSYPAGFSHTNLKLCWVVFRASFLFLSEAKGIMYDTKGFTHLEQNFFSHKSKRESETETSFIFADIVGCDKQT